MEEMYTFISKSAQLKDAWKSDAWPRSCLASVNEAAFQMEVGQIKTARELCGFLALKRKEIAKASNSEEFYLFGAPREDVESGAWTRIVSPKYGDFITPLKKKYDELTKKLKQNENTTAAKYLNLTREQKEAYASGNVELYQSLQIQKAELEKTSSMLPVPDESFDIAVSIFHNGDPYTVIGEIEGGFLLLHSPTESIEKAFSKIEPVFKKIMDANDYFTNEEKFKELIQDIGLVAWHIYHAMPYHRGSAAIVEMMICSLLKYKQIQLPRYNEDVICDLKAMYEPDPEKFSTEFYSYFIWPDFKNRFDSDPWFLMKENSKQNLKILEKYFEHYSLEKCYEVFNVAREKYADKINAHQHPFVDKFIFLKNTHS